jgi:membrane protein implicated in regulation of membrane protease activity
MDVWSWGWLILAAVLLVGEMLTFGLVLIVFGIGALGAFFVSIFGGGVIWQWVVFLVVSAVTLGFSRKFAKRIHRGPEDFGVGAERYTGQKAWVTESIDKSAATGMVRIDREEWRADSATGEAIPAETWVEVVEVDGTSLVVKPVAGGPAEEPATPDVDWGADRTDRPEE